MNKLRIKELCKERGIALSALAELVGISQPSMSLIVNGKQKPSFDTLEKIATGLNVGIGELFAPLEGAKIICPHCGEIITLKVDQGENLKL